MGFFFFWGGGPPRFLKKNMGKFGKKTTPVFFKLLFLFEASFFLEFLPVAMLDAVNEPLCTNELHKMETEKDSHARNSVRIWRATSKAAVPWRSRVTARH